MKKMFYEVINIYYFKKYFIIFVLRALIVPNCCKLQQNECNFIIIYFLTYLHGFNCSKVV